MDNEKEVSRTMRYLAGYPKAVSHLNESQVNFWLDNYSDTLYCNGELRRIVFKPITSTRYEVRTEEIK